MSSIIIMCAVVMLLTSVMAMALMWVLSMEHTFRSSVREEAERLAEQRFAEMCANAEYRVHYDQYIICGQGFETQEDKITMTRATTLRPGGLYVHLSGDVYKCLRTTADGCAVLMDINSGTLLTVRSVRAYHDGKIDYQIVECARLAGAAV